MKKFFVVMVLFALCAPADAIYKCKNPDGSISFSDAPCGARDEGVDMEKEQEYQEAVERRKREALEMRAMELRERNATLVEVRKKKDVFARQYHRVLDENAWPHYTQEAYPELVEEYFDRMIEVEDFRYKAVPLVLNSQRCDQVTRSGLDREWSKIDNIYITVECRNGNQFRMSEQGIKEGIVPSPIFVNGENGDDE